MKIAFVDNLPVGGGLSRFSYMLCNSLIQEDPSITVDYFVHETNIRNTPELRSMPARVSVKLLKSSLPPTLLKRIIRRIGRKLGATPAKGNDMIGEIEDRVKEYDVAYFPSAHMMKKPKLSIPVVGTIHDFNWKYFFGSQIFTRDFVEEMDLAVPEWITSGKTICSSHDVVAEAKKLYPGLPAYPEVVHIAPVAFSKNIEESEAEKILTDLNIDYPYIIFPGNFYPHKNHLNLYTAFFMLRQRKGFESLKLILTGINTDKVSFGIAGRTGVQLVTGNSPNQHYDIRGLGYQPNRVIDALIKKARLLVSASIYEAICTPGMDAWHFGTPTAISDIAPFREHEQVWGIRSAFFDPMNPEAIADTLEKYLNNYSLAKEDGLISQKNMSNYTWNITAKGYLDIFKKAIREHK